MTKDAVILLLLTALCCACRFGLAIEVNLTASCANSQIYFCSFSNVSATLDDPLVLVNASAPQLSALVLRNSLITRVPRELFVQAPNLRTFFMHNCGLNRLEPYDFQQARSLRKLVLQHNRLSDLPEKVFSAAYALEQLLLGHNMIHMVHATAFSGLSQLRYIDLQQNNIRRLPATLFADLAALEHLDLSSNEIETIDSQTFAAISGLKTLLLADNKFAVFEPNSLEHIPHLHLLDLSSSTLDELHLQSVDTLQVQSSNLKRCTIAGSAIKVHAGNNQLTSISIGDKLAVRELDLHANLLESLEDVVGMLNLQRLDVSRNQLQSLRTSRAPLYLPLPSLVHLNLATNQLHNLSVEQFMLLQKLTHLDLSFNHLLRLDQHILQPLINLEKFYIEGNRLHAFDYEQFLRTHEYLKEFGIFENEWEFRYMRKMVNFLKEHSVQLPVRFASSTPLNQHDSMSTLPPAGKATTHHRYTSPANFVSEEETVAALSRTHEPMGVTGIHPYWTTRDVLALITLLFVLLVLLLQLFNILREERCFTRCCRLHVRNANNEERQRLDEEDSEV